MERLDREEREVEIRKGKGGEERRREIGEGKGRGGEG